MWVAFAISFPILYANAPDAMVTVGDRTFVAADIFETADIMCLFTHVAFGLLGGFKAMKLTKSDS